MIILSVRELSEDPRNNKAPRRTDVRFNGRKFQDPHTGNILEIFRVKVMAKAIDRDPMNISRWCRNGRLRPPVFTVEGNICKSWFSYSQVMNAHRIFLGRYRGKKYLKSVAETEQFYADIRSIWYAETLVINEDGTEMNGVNL